MHPAGRVAYPSGVELQAPPGFSPRLYNGEPNADVLARLQQRVTAGPFRVHIDQAFELQDCRTPQEPIKRSCSIISASSFFAFSERHREGVLELAPVVASPAQGRASFSSTARSPSTT